MPKLHLKRTPAEEAERAWKKARKQERRAKKRSSRGDVDADHDEPPASSSRYSHSYDAEKSQQEKDEDAFNDRLRGAMEDDGLFDSSSRLDGMSAHMNSYSHIPRRWRGTEEGFSTGVWMEDAADDIGLQPWQMNDDEYAEYIRAGMWR